MPKPLPPYLHKEITRHGHIAWYVRAGKGPRTRIRGEFGSEHFMMCYSAAIVGDPLPALADGYSKVARVGMSPKQSGHIYFASDGSHIKIGFASSVKNRIRALQTGHHKKLVVLRVEKGTMEDEAKFHERFAALRARGEWFRRDGELAKYVGAEPVTFKPFKEIRL
jgi:hypothetical protein